MAERAVRVGRPALVRDEQGLVELGSGKDPLAGRLIRRGRAGRLSCAPCDGAAQRGRAAS
jgi:hypothetical protein